MIAARAGGSGSMPAWQDVVRGLHDHALFWHVVRLAVAVSAGTLVYRLADLAHGYWIPLTTLAVLQPGHHETDVQHPNGRRERSSRPCWSSSSRS